MLSAAMEYQLSCCQTMELRKIMNEVYELWGIKKSYTTAYHPQTDRLVEIS